ncbi:thioredoxin [Pseudoxanthobacter soli DSM 19599]|uniref:Thioredoxin n=1 Tax=Pseudoxanthobacter soli DSM 19599 TaxID=1123029 RepID=A0A1M7ZK80_9HYPH|nr:thioredoxin [Pseudoxanthobacter soli]SHO65219.1 thioredoxin [Pseudoxanthobacter soli DSM 19599]
MSESLLFGNAAPAKAAAPSAAADDVVNTTTATFAQDVLAPSRQVPVLVDFWAPWCGPCKQLAPVIEKVVRAAKGRVRLVKMNIDDHPEIAGQLGIRSIPAVIAFANGQPVDGFMGAVPESQIQAFIDRIAGPGGGPDIAAVLDEADALRASGDIEGATARYAAVIEADPEAVRAFAGLAQIAVAEGDLDGARETLAAVPPEKANDPALAAVRAAIELAEQAADLGDGAVLAREVEVDPDNHQARFDLALLLAAQNDRQGALDHLIEIIRRDRTWNEDGARKQLLQFFEAWGPKDPMTREGRRRLSSVLFS